MDIQTFKNLVIEKAKAFVKLHPSIMTTLYWDQDKYFKFRTDKACFRDNTHYELRVIPPKGDEIEFHFVIEYHFEKKDDVRLSFMKFVKDYFGDVTKYYFEEGYEHRIRLVKSLLEGTLWYSMADDVVASNIDAALNDLASFVENDEDRLVELIRKAEESILSDEEKFKHLLEYFVAHLEYVQSGITGTVGYERYIKPITDFAKTGKGCERGQKIQSQIKEWSLYSNGAVIAINVNTCRNKTAKFAARLSYLNWFVDGGGTWKNIAPQWQEHKIVTGFFLTDFSNRTRMSSNYSNNDLGLFDGLPANGKIKELLDKFKGLLLPEQERKNKTMFENDEMLKILKRKKNLVLQGAPGTGKTFETASLALKMLNEMDVDYEDRESIMKRYKERVNEKRIAFVTFHQTMDYESFVEGLRAVPIKDENGKIAGGVSYEPKPGIFKEICDLASTKDGDDIETCIDKYLASITGSANKKLIPTSTGRSKFYVWWEGGEATTLKVRSIDCENANPEYTPSPLNIQKVKDQATGNGVENNWKQYAAAFINAVKAEYAVKDGDEKMPYVLIIDEINRGNVSKIFGELITLLEPDKRQGEINELSAKLTYSGAAFTVPSNLYIIGTMNTTDRSVGAIDYAIRRRFAFVTLESKSEIIENYPAFESQEVKTKALALYNAVSEFLDDKDNKVDMDFDDLMVGHSYFLAKTMDDLLLKWDYEVLPLLREYYKDGMIKKNPDDQTWPR
ncbi:MAG: AAA family ATPase [Bacteroidales bacterium]|nr:AAA family ATPase [Bacteroidales bacterium]